MEIALEASADQIFCATYGGRHQKSWTALVLATFERESRLVSSRDERPIILYYLILGVPYSV